VARVVKPQGRRGEVAAELLTDFPERFAERRRLLALQHDGTRRELQMESHWPHKGRMVFKFAGVDSISAAEELSGCELQIPLEERAELEAGAAYVGDLIGCVVTDGGRELGEIVEIQSGAGDAPLLVVRSGKKEWLVPFAAEFVTRLDVGAKRLDMRLPEGLLEVDER
jgi:16S rRNA processing protein RimM